MKKAKMKRMFLVWIVASGLVLSWIVLCSGDFYVIPVKSAHAPVEETGQSGCWDSLGASIPCTGTGQDGEYQKGVTWPSQRFTDNADGTVTDNLTGLIWLKKANCSGGTKNWSDALTYANSLYDGWSGDPGGGDCGLSDGSSAGDWRLANVKELQSLIDFGNHSPPLPSGHPFTGVLGPYWSSTSLSVNPSSAWVVYMGYGRVSVNDKADPGYVWPVRGGQ